MITLAKGRGTYTFTGEEAAYMAATYRGHVKSEGSAVATSVTYARTHKGTPPVTGYRLMTQPELKKACNGCWVRFERADIASFGPSVFLGRDGKEDLYMVTSGRYKRCVLRVTTYHEVSQ